MSECIFCKIVKGEIPAHKILETDGSLAFLDVKPHAKGHTVVIPKRHVVVVEDLHEGEFGRFMEDVKEAMKEIQDVLLPDGFNVGWNHKQAGGQVVPHLHVHIMPRWEGDGGGSMHSVINNQGDLSVGQVAELFRNS